MNNIRNFCILAHIDHGKSTLADRFLELTGTIEKRKMREQVLDQMDIERERGITIKMTPVRMNYTLNANRYTLNLIDTPGHVDFSYEVSRALAAVEGAIVLVDATQGVQAQTIANVRLAKRENLVIIPAVNKIDLPTARIKETEDEIRTLLELDLSASILRVSGKTGDGVEELLCELIRMIPPPRSEVSPPTPYQKLRALIFDSHFDAYKGVIAYIRIVDGAIKKNDKISFCASGARAEILEVGHFIPHQKSVAVLNTGEIGYVATGIKAPEKVRVGDTITKSQVTNHKSQTTKVESLSGYHEPQPMVYASFYPEDADDFELLKDAFNKLKLNDAALTYEIESSDVLGRAALTKSGRASPISGRGFRCGFLGTLHLEIVSARLEREYNLNLVVTTPSVAYRIRFVNGKEEMVYRASAIPKNGVFLEILEPWVRLEIVTPSSFMGSISQLLRARRATGPATENFGENRVLLTFEVPLAEIVVDLHDQLKSISQGYASMEYRLLEWRKGDVERMDILVVGEEVSAFSRVVPHTDTERIGRETVARLKELLPKALFPIPLQAAAGGRIVARETIPAMRKDVTGYLYGGDRTRKMKLWKKQQKGKKRLKESAHVDIPPDVFLKMLKK